MMRPTVEAPSQPGTDLVRLMGAYSSDIRWEAYASAPIAWGRTILILGGIAQGTFVAGVIWGALLMQHIASTFVNLLPFVFATALVVINISVARMARPYYMRRHLSSVASDPRSPIIYLRSFLVDDETTAEELHVGLSWGYKWSLEEELCGQLASLAPVICIGRPGDRLPPGRAVRIYVNDGVWQDFVGELIELAGAIIIRPGTSRGLSWELSRVARPDLVQKLTLLSVDRRGQPLDKAAHRIFADSIATLLGRQLPPKAWHTWFFMFDVAPRMIAIDAKVPPPSRADFRRAIGELKSFLKSRLAHRAVTHSVFRWRDQEMPILQWFFPMIVTAILLAIIFAR
jgi:hypothetical protein